MSTPTYPVFFTGSSGTSHTDEVRQGGFVPAYPLGERRPDALVVTAQFQRKRANYVRPTPNAFNCSAYPLAVFCDDSGFRDIGMGVVEWTRTWATVPGQTIEFETYAYTFPGYAASVLTPGRVPLAKQITSKLVMDFYLVGGGGAYSDPAAIPVIYGQQYTYGPWSGTQAAEYLDTVSSPTLTAYKALVTADAADPATYSIEAHDSILENYMGNIWRRTRRLVKAR